jgi:hypothetical protein
LLSGIAIPSTVDDILFSSLEVLGTRYERSWPFPAATSRRLRDKYYSQWA